MRLNLGDTFETFLLEKDDFANLLSELSASNISKTEIFGFESWFAEEEDSDLLISIYPHFLDKRYKESIPSLPASGNAIHLASSLNLMLSINKQLDAGSLTSMDGLLTCPIIMFEEIAESVSLVCRTIRVSNQTRMFEDCPTKLRWISAGTLLTLSIGS